MLPSIFSILKKKEGKSNGGNGNAERWMWFLRFSRLIGDIREALQFVMENIQGEEHLKELINKLEKLGAYPPK